MKCKPFNTLKTRFEVAAPTDRLNMPTLINIGFQLCDANNNEGKIKGPSETAIVRQTEAPLAPSIILNLPAVAKGISEE